MTAALTVSALSKSFDDIGSVVHDLDLTGRAGDLVVVTGGRESGKTTVLRCLGGTYLPSSGTVTLTLADMHCDLATAPARAIAWIRRHHLAAFDGPLIAPPSQPVADAVARAAQIPREDAVAALNRLGETKLADVSLGRLRPVQRRAVALTAVLASQAAVILLDEPESLADAEALIGWLEQRRADGTLVVVATRPDSALQQRASTVIHLEERLQT
jgi:ABC-type transport system involved in cytochrome c biogenesis ATPase subunit